MVMKKLSFTFLISFCVITLIKGDKCVEAYTGEGESQNSTRTVHISRCVALPCPMQVGTHVEVAQKFVPNKDLTYLSTSVVAKTGLMNVPFWGVDGEDASTDIYDENGNRATWPLIAGNLYLYKKQFLVKGHYPRRNLIVQWKLVEDGDDITCFEVPVKFTS